MTAATAARRGAAGGEPLVFLAALSWAAAAIHAVVAVPHFAKYARFGAAFLVVALAQAAWAVVAYRRADRACLVAGILLSAAVVLAWVVSRTVGLPIGPEAGHPEAIGFPDMAAGADELALVALAASLLRAPPRAAVLGVWARQGALAVLIFSGVALMTTGHAHA